MNDQTSMEFADNEVQQWADSHMIIWDAKDDAEVEVVRNWMKDNCPLQLGSGCEMLKEFQTSPNSGLVILEFDTDEMTEDDATHLQHWLDECPADTVIYSAMVSLGGIVRINDDDPEFEMETGGPVATLH